ncbi:MAG: hypothetical protein ACRDTA_14295 [Pseudonocardiaceae bacterium]
MLSGRLRHEVSVIDCGFADRAPVSEDLHEGLHCSGTLDGTLRMVVELSGRDMRRRKFMLGSAFSAAALSEPALFALTVPPAESTARAGGRRVGMTDVEILTEQVTQLRQLHHRYGSGRLREQVVSLLHREAGTYSDKTGKALLTAVAQATKLAGFTAADVGRAALAQRYFIQGLDLAMAAGDRLYAAAVLSEMSRMTLQTGWNALTEQDRLRNGARRWPWPGPGWPSPRAQRPRRWPPSCTRWKPAVLPWSTTPGRRTVRCWQPNGPTSRCVRRRAPVAGPLHRGRVRRRPRQVPA